MAISKKQAIKKAFDLLASRIEDRLEVVNQINGTLYMADKLDLENCWIIYVKPENQSSIIEWNDYILVSKKTGKAFCVRTN